MSARVVCPRCGRPRDKADHSGLATHARCYFPRELADDLLDVRFEFSPRLTDRRMADDLGVPIHVLRAVLDEAWRRRGGSR